jgi:hexosaminidase
VFKVTRVIAARPGRWHPGGSRPGEVFRWTWPAPLFTLEEARRAIDLLALYKLNVPHLHLTDDQGWRLPVGRAAQGAASADPFYGAGDLRALAGYAADRFVTVVPEVGTPGRVAALIRMHRASASGRPAANAPRRRAGG